MKLKIIFASLCTCLFALIFLPGCASTQSAVERYLFDTTTNTVPVVVTNPATGDIVTKQVPTVEMVPSVALKSWGSLLATVADTLAPGVGKLTLTGLLGGAGIFALNRQKKLTRAQMEAAGIAQENDSLNLVADNFAQSIEVLREVLKTTPQGQALDLKIVDMLHKNQVTAGIIRQAAEIVSGSVSNEAAKKIAAKILETVPAPLPA